MSAEWRVFAKVTLPLSGLNLINQASRTVMAVIGPALALEFALSAGELGLLAACMFAAYALAQLPEGLALDRIGPWRLRDSRCSRWRTDSSALPRRASSSASASRPA